MCSSKFVCVSSSWICCTSTETIRTISNSEVFGTPWGAQDGTATSTFTQLLRSVCASACVYTYTGQECTAPTHVLKTQDKKEKEKSLSFLDTELHMIQKMVLDGNCERTRVCLFWSLPKTVKSQNKATSRQHIVIFSPASLQCLPAPCWGTEKDDDSDKNVGKVPQLRVWNRQQS